ncbi:hypothetical protein DPMN_003570 [Dreissena polymorpha]|uniref:Uncharacterized protein n=1 Tax=Dreissena polymorpha TaxID=45954 RepID=A0A9D4MPK7_DREPO|nr:hypothetical protein DPMN_003570 [Dreissena polymorpha]
MGLGYSMSEYRWSNNRSSIFFLKVKGLSFSITKEGGCGGVGVGTGDGLGGFAHLRGFHDDWTKNVTSKPKRNKRISQSAAARRNNSMPRQSLKPHLASLHGSMPSATAIHRVNTRFGSRVLIIWPHVIQITGTIFKLNSHIKETNVLTKFHENRAKNVTSRVFTCFHYVHNREKCPAHWPPTGSHVFSPIWIIFILVRDINKTNVLTNFHDDWAKIVTSRVFTRKTAPPIWGHVFQRTGTTFKLNQHIIKTNIFTNFKLDQDFIGRKLLTKFHEDWTINVASRVFTNKCGRTDR